MSCTLDMKMQKVRASMQASQKDCGDILLGRCSVNNTFVANSIETWSGSSGVYCDINVFTVLQFRKPSCSGMIADQVGLRSAQFRTVHP